MPSHPIRLVTCIGVKSSPHLISHFLEHYHSLGVDEFLIVLHAAAGDERVLEAKQRLAKWGIRPVREIEEYSSALKHLHTVEVVLRHCEPQSWVIYADLDEFHVYPGGLLPYLEDRERYGQSVARGRIVDRLTLSGELSEIQPHPSLWEQFPRSWPVTRRLIGAWDRKICAARASVTIADGGPHSVQYGYTATWNYRLTHYLPKRGERGRVAVHHFKWDATLQQRVREKVEGAGGDRDRWDGVDFMHEYRLLDAHLRRNGRICVPTR